MDYPRSDRHFLLALRRLTRIHARSVEEPVNLDDGEEYNWPWLYGVEVGHWELTDDQARSSANICCAEASSCATISTAPANGRSSCAACSSVFPDRTVVDLDDKDPIFHAIYDLDDRIPGSRRVPVVRRGVHLRAGRHGRAGAASTTITAA